MRLKTTVHGSAMQIIINRAVLVPHVHLFHLPIQAPILNRSLAERAAAVNRAHVIAPPAPQAAHLHLHAQDRPVVVIGLMVHGHTVVRRDIPQPHLDVHATPFAAVSLTDRPPRLAHRQIVLQTHTVHLVMQELKHAMATILTVRVRPRARRAQDAAVMAHAAHRASRPVVMVDFIYPVVHVPHVHHRTPAVPPAPRVVLVRAIHHVRAHAPNNHVRQMRHAHTDLHPHPVQNIMVGRAMLLHLRVR